MWTALGDSLLMNGDDNYPCHFWIRLQRIGLHLWLLPLVFLLTWTEGSQQPWWKLPCGQVPVQENESGLLTASEELSQGGTREPVRNLTPSVQQPMRNWILPIITWVDPYPNKPSDVSLPQPTVWLQGQERPSASHIQISDSRSWDNKCFLSQAANFWGNLLYGNK